MTLEQEVMLLENPILKSRVAELESHLLAPWMPAIRAELEQQLYAHAVKGQDAAEAFRLLRVPGELVLLDPVPIEHVRAALSEIQFNAVSQNNAGWLAIVSGQTAILAGVTAIPRSRIVKIQEAAIADGMLEAGYQIGAVSLTPLESLGCSEIVTHFGFISLTMGW